MLKYFMGRIKNNKYFVMWSSCVCLKRTSLTHFTLLNWLLNTIQQLLVSRRLRTGQYGVVIISIIKETNN